MADGNPNMATVAEGLHIFSRGGCSLQAAHVKSEKESDSTSLFQAGLGLLDGVSQIRAFTPRGGRYPFGKSENLPRPVPALSLH